jgi:adenylate kinase family enzyme
VQRVAVVGNSGSGKSTLGRALAATIRSDFIELDSIFHQPGWQPLDTDEFRRRISTIAAADSWVIDGNYGAVRPLIWARADTIVWLDLPRGRVMRQIVWRTLRRLARRQVLWNGNRERWQNFLSLDPQQSVIAWSWQKHADYRRRYGEAMNDPANAHLSFVRIRSRQELRALLQRGGSL